MDKAISEIHVDDVPAPLPPGVVVLDVREQFEWEAGHIEHAVHVPLMQVPQRLDEIPIGQPILVVCKVGSRSAQATGFLQANGRDAVNLAGGMMSWEYAGRAMVASGDAEPMVA